MEMGACCPLTFEFFHEGIAYTRDFDYVLRVPMMYRFTGYNIGLPKAKLIIKKN